MPSIDDLARIADTSSFIFTGSIIRTESPSAVDAETVVVSVKDVIKVPLGLRGFAGREVTVRLRHPLSAGDFVFFANPLTVGETIALKESAHLEGIDRREADAALERGYASRMAPRLAAAFLVALGTVGDVHSLISPGERWKGPPWASAPFDVERILKGRRPRRVTLVGPLYGYKLLPRTPALRKGLHAILILQRPPQEAIERLPDNERQAAVYIADTSDIQPPDRFEDLARIIGRSDRE